MRIEHHLHVHVRVHVVDALGWEGAADLVLHDHAWELLLVHVLDAFDAHGGGHLVVDVLAILPHLPAPVRRVPVRVRSHLVVAVGVLAIVSVPAVAPCKNISQHPPYQSV